MIMSRTRSCGPGHDIAQAQQQVAGLEQVDPQVGQRQVRGAGLLLEVRHARAVDAQHAEARAVGRGHRLGGDGDARAVAPVLADHVAVVHAVDLIAGEDQRHVGVLRRQHVEVVVEGVRRAAVPQGVGAAGVRQQDADAAVAAVEIPGAPEADVLLQRTRRVLRRHVDAVHARVDTVGQGER
jgi:hypothetical protein